MNGETDRSEILRKHLKEAVEKEPRLTTSGIGLSRDTAKGEWLEKFKQFREELLQRSDQFEIACNWLIMQNRIKKIGRYRSSYALKHCVENWAHKNKLLPSYISNGAFIAAAIHLGFECKPTEPESLTVFINISKNLVGCERAF